MTTRRSQRGYLTAAAALPLIWTVVGTPSISQAVEPTAPVLVSEIADLGTLVGYSHAGDVDGDLATGYAYDGADHLRAVAWHLDTGELVDLGTFGGLQSVAAAVDGTVVVGSAQRPHGEDRAFVYDFAEPSPHLVDLGTLGGDYSVARAVSDGVVVGMSANANGAERGFAYDLNAASPHMESFGTPGYVTRPVAVDHGVVVGSFHPVRGGATRAFVYDLNAADPRLVVLDTFGGDDSEATDVAGDLVVGWARTSGGGRHGFVYDLSAAQPTMRDLSADHPNHGSIALATDGTTVVGSESDRGGTHAFAYDTAAAAPVLRDLGTLGGGQSEAVDIDRGVAVGSADLVDGRHHAFAYDTTDPDGEMTDLGTLGRGQYSDATAVSGRRVVGDAPPDANTVHAAVWTVGGRASQAFEFTDLQGDVSEAAGAATITVDRIGSTQDTATVRYATGPITARRNADFQDTRGTLTFAPGETRKTVSVPIVDDDLLEPSQVFAVRLSRPSDNAELSTPDTRTVAIDPSDQRPDTWISTQGPGGGFIGNDRYADAGDRQIKRLRLARGQTDSFYVRVFNDGNVESVFKLTAPPAGTGTRVRYYVAGDDVTAALRSRDGLPVSLRPASWIDVSHPPRTVLIEARVHVNTHAQISSVHPVSVRATWSGDSRRWDAVRGTTIVTR